MPCHLTVKSRCLHKVRGTHHMFHRNLKIKGNILFKCIKEIKIESIKA